MERLQLRAVSEDWEDVGGLAWFMRGLDYLGYESRVVGFPALDGYGGCAQPVASGYGSANRFVVQVSRVVTFNVLLVLVANSSRSFLVRDAQEDIAGTRLKD
jgi:hypothetical protein